jgi:hypothetical protein
MNNIVKQLVNDDGAKIPEDEQVWHLQRDISGDTALLCTGEFIHYGSASGNGEIYELKETKKGGITCPDCLGIIREFKAVKL